MQSAKAQSPHIADGLEITGPILPGFDKIWTAEAKAFVGALAARFSTRRNELLAARKLRQQEFDNGVMPDFLPQTRHIRDDASWKCAPIPADLQDRRVEITGPVERKMIINALNSGARVFMADFEDSASPTWELMVQGQINLIDAIRGTITFDQPDGKHYKLNDKVAVLMVRPRGWHLFEKHVLLNGQPIPGGLMDFGLYFFHNLAALRTKGTGPYFYLPKMESHLEARLWNDVFVFAQEQLGVPKGTIRATVLIETLPAAFEMDEFLYELREHAAGLNCGRWDYIFNYIKCFRHHPAFVTPAREQITMTAPFLHAYSQLLIKTCHHRGIHAMGGMAAQIPNKDKVINDEMTAKVREDKQREVRNGHDGTWVGHPGLVALAKEVFDEYMPTANQIFKTRDDVEVSAADLVEIPVGTIELESLRHNVGVSLRYLESWLRGSGCVPLYGLMEDAATAEIARAQIWQWIRYPKGVLSDGRKITVSMFNDFLNGELEAARKESISDPSHHRFDDAAKILERLATSDELSAFLTSEAYSLLP